MQSFKVNGAEPFQVPNKNGKFCISPSAQGYTLNFSADGVDYSPIKIATPQNETALFGPFSEGLWYKLVGNTSEVTIQC